MRFPPVPLASTLAKMSESMVQIEAPIIPYQGAPRRKKLSIWPIFFLALILLAIPYIVGYLFHFIIYNYFTQGNTPRLHALAYNNFVASTSCRLWGYYVMMFSDFIAVASFLYRAKTSLRSLLGLRRPNSTMVSTLVFMVGVLGLDAVVVSLQSSLNLHSASVQHIYDFLAHARTEAPIQAFLIIAFVGPILEEVICRGYIQTRLIRRLGPMWGILLASILFGIFHRDFVQGGFAVLVGIYQGAVRYRTGSLFPAILCHIAVNATYCIIIFTGLGPILTDHVVVLTGWVVMLASCYLLSKTPAPFSEYRGLRRS